MKNLFKISAMVFAVVMVFVLVLTTKAADDSLVTVTLTDGNSTCILSGFDMSTGVSVSDQVVIDQNTLSCDFLSSGVQTLAIVSDSLASSASTIDATNVNGSGSNLTEGGSLSCVATCVLSSGAIDSSQTVYQKGANENGTMTQDIDIEVTIPGGTPAGVYTGYLDLTIT